MNVLHFSNVIGRNRGGGVHEVAFNYWNYQNSFGFSSELWFPGKQEEIESLKPEIINHAAIRALETYFHPDLGIIKHSENIFKAFDKFDVIHQHGIWLLISGLTHRAKKELNRKIVIQPHGYLEPYSLRRSKLKKLIQYRLFEKKNLENCDCLLACSDQELNNLRYFFPGKDIALIPNGLQKSFFEATSSTDYFMKKKYGKRKNLLFLSRVHPTKGLERLLEIFSSIQETTGNDWNLIIAGIGDESYINTLKAKVRHLKLEEKVFFEGPVFGSDKGDMLASADLFVLPTFSENFGVVIAEALAKGVPALTTHSAPWESLEEYKCGFWVPDSTEGIKNGLIKAMRLSEQELKEMGEKGKKLVSEKFIWDDIVLQTIELYKWLLHGGEAPSFVYKGDKHLKNRSIF